MPSSLCRRLPAILLQGQSGQCALPPLFRSGRIRRLQVHHFRILAATSGQGTIHQAGCALRIRPADARRGVEVCRKGEGRFHHAGTRQLEQRRPLRHAHLVARLRLWMGGDSPSYPHFLKKAYKNQITWKWHVQIPYSYWEKKYPSKDYSAKEREAAIQKYMDSVEQNLCGPDNAEKPIFSHYAVNEMNGRIEEEWKIKPLENKYQGSDNLPVSAAANSEILFALMVNPNVLGAGMPGGTYAGNQGGSNIREAFLVNIANAWIDRQNILDPIELYIKMNGMPECELRFRNTVLVTLDTGSGTKNIELMIFSAKNGTTARS